MSPLAAAFTPALESASTTRFTRSELEPSSSRVRDHPGLEDARDDPGDAADHPLTTDDRAECVVLLHAVLQRHDRGLRPDERNDGPGGSFRVPELHRDHDEVDRAHGRGIDRDADAWKREVAGAALDAKPPFAHCAGVLASRDEVNLVPRSGETRAVVTTHSSRPHDRDPHDVPPWQPIDRIAVGAARAGALRLPAERGHRAMRTEPAPSRIILLTGTVGSGKTTVAVEIGRQLELAGETCAVVDLDWLGWVHAGDSFRDYDELIAANLEAIWPNIAATGAVSLVLARGLVRAASLDALRARFPATPFFVARLLASPGTIASRLASRDRGATLQEHLVEAASMEAAIAEAALEDVAVLNDGAEVEEVARAVLAAAAAR
jgi:hypothetical protein